MTIQRQYSLPNCKLIVEGLADSTNANAGVRPVMSVVTNVECRFLGSETVLSGGRDFLESLAIAVSNYAQEFLSSVPHPHHREGKANLVSLERVSTDLHRLKVEAEAPSLEMNGSQVAGRRVASPPVQVDLRTGHLFDLVDAIDQLFADTQTVPDLTLQLKPVSKRYAVTHEPMTKQAVPAAIGLASLAAAAIALFFVPIPERRPQSATEPTTQSSPASPSAIAASSPGASPDGEPTSPPSAIAAVLASPSASPASAEVTPEASASASPTETSSPSPAALSGALDSSPEITDPAQLSTLKLQLRDNLASAWTQPTDFQEDLVYQVSAAQNGDILGFRYMNQSAVNYANQTPLPDLQYKPAEQTDPEPVGLFRVVFTPGGVVQVSPWYGTPDPAPSP